MRILLVADLHINKPKFNWVLDVSGQFDAICIPGDFLDMLIDLDAYPLFGQIRWVQDWFKRLQTPTFVCSGNHDWFCSHPQAAPLINANAEGGWLDSSNAQVFSDKSNTLLKTHRFICNPWLGTPKLHNPSKSPIVLLTHAPAAETTLSKDLTADYGDEHLLETIYALPPSSLVLSGHVHEAKNWYLKIGHAHCFNAGVGYPDQKAPNHIIIDTVAKTATLHGWNRITVRQLI